MNRIDSRPDSRGNPSTAGIPSTDALYEAAQKDFFDHRGRQASQDQIQAYMHVLLGDTEQMRERLREGVEMSGMIQSIPQLASFPLDTNALRFSSEEELREFTEDPMAQELVLKQREERAEALVAYRQWATVLVENLTTLAETRLRGASPSGILTTENLRTVLATELVSQKMMAGITTTRREVQQALEGLMQQSEAGVKAGPLAGTMQKIGQLCRQMSDDMEKLEVMGARAAGHQQGEGAGQSHSDIVSYTRRAQEIFHPFIQGNHLITMEQLRELESFLRETGNYNEDVSILISEGTQAIHEAKVMGHHQTVRQIEGFLSFDRQVANFERGARAIHDHFKLRAAIVANASFQNRAVLRATPAEMLREAEQASGLSREKLLNDFSRTDPHLVLPSHDGLKLR